MFKHIDSYARLQYQLFFSVITKKYENAGASARYSFTSCSPTDVKLKALKHNDLILIKYVEKEQVQGHI